MGGRGISCGNRKRVHIIMVFGERGGIYCANEEKSGYVASRTFAIVGHKVCFPCCGLDTNSHTQPMTHTHTHTQFSHFFSLSLSLSRNLPTSLIVCLCCRAQDPHRPRNSIPHCMHLRRCRRPLLCHQVANNVHVLLDCGGPHLFIFFDTSDVFVAWDGVFVAWNGVVVALLVGIHRDKGIGTATNAAGHAEDEAHAPRRKEDDCCDEQRKEQYQKQRRQEQQRDNEADDRDFEDRQEPLRHLHRVADLVRFPFRVALRIFRRRIHIDILRVPVIEILLHWIRERRVRERHHLEGIVRSLNIRLVRMYQARQLVVILLHDARLGFARHLEHGVVILLKFDDSLNFRCCIPASSSCMRTRVYLHRERCKQSSSSSCVSMDCHKFSHLPRAHMSYTAAFNDMTKEEYNCVTHNDDDQSTTQRHHTADTSRVLRHSSSSQRARPPAPHIQTHTLSILTTSKQANKQEGEPASNTHTHTHE